MSTTPNNDFQEKVPNSNESSTSKNYSPGKVLALERLIREKNCGLNLAGTVGQQLLEKYAKTQKRLQKRTQKFRKFQLLREINGIYQTQLLGHQRQS